MFMREINSNSTPTHTLRGFFEQWYFGERAWEGIRVADKEKLEYPRFVGEAFGLSLGNTGFYGINCQPLFYDEKSFLYNGVIITHSKRREFFGRVKSKRPKIKVATEMPETIVTLLAEKQEAILELAKRLHLPLEQAVLTTP